MRPFLLQIKQLTTVTLSVIEKAEEIILSDKT